MTTNETTEELMERHRLAQAEEARARLAEANELTKSFAEFAAKKGAKLDSNSFSYVRTIGIVASAPGLAKQILGQIPTERDDLLSMQSLAASHKVSPYQPGYFVGGNYMLMAHPFFRRQMHEHANFAPRFVDLFWEFDSHGVNKYIAIDDDRLRINVDGSTYFEADTWYGAPFNEDIEQIPNGTAKLRPPIDLEDTYVDFFFARAYCLDIKWSQQDQIKTFQALEVKTPSARVLVNGQQFYPARYLHAEFDLSAGHFRHFDGAVQLFREDEYLQRRDSDFHVNEKYQVHVKARSKKLFKLNGPVSTTSWVELCCHFFTGNPLVFEYFTGAYPAHITDALHKLRTRRENAGDA